MPRISSPRPLDLTKPFVTSSQSYGSQPFDLSQNLVTWYRDIQGDFVPDLSGRGNNARCAGSGSHDRVTGSSDIPEYNSLYHQIYSFDLSDNATSATNVKHIKSVNGTGESASLEDHSFTDGTRDIPFSISFWAKLDSTASTQYIVSKGEISASSSLDEWSIFVDSSNSLSIRLFSQGSAVDFIYATLSSAFPGTYNGWDHFVITYNGSGIASGINVYRNGAVVSTSKSSLGAYVRMQNSNRPLCIGSTFTSVHGISTSDLRGKIHSFAIWKGQVISSREVSALFYTYRNGTGGEARSGFISRSPRLHLRELDDLPGSYSTVRRTGDPTRTGALSSNFNDETAIVFSQSGSVVFPTMLPKGSSFASQAVDIIGQESDISASLPIRSFQQPNHLHYSPVEEAGPFDENRVMPATDFFLSGTDPNTLPGFTSPTRSKIAIEIDVTTSAPKKIQKNKRSRTLRNDSSSTLQDQTGFCYFNFGEMGWQDIGLTDPVSKAAIPFDVCITASDDAANWLGNSSLVGQFVPVTTNVKAYDDAQYASITIGGLDSYDWRDFGAVDRIGRPSSYAAAPNDTKYYATSSQVLKLSSFISSPVMLEKVVFEFDEVNVVRVQDPSDVRGSSSNKLGTYSSIGSNYTFFLYHQEKSRSVINPNLEVSSSVRHLIVSASAFFYSTGAIALDSAYSSISARVNQTVRHDPNFKYDFNLTNDSSVFSEGRYTGKLRLEAIPCVQGAEYHGSSRIICESGAEWSNVNQRYVSSQPVLSAWPGGTSARFSKTQASDLAVALVQNTLNPTWSALTYETGEKGSYEFDNNKVNFLSSQKAFRRFGGESSRLKVQQLGGWLNPEDTQPQSEKTEISNSPYILMPEDELVFGVDSSHGIGIGWDAGTPVNTGSWASLTSSYMEITSKPARIILYGSMVKNEKEFLPALNQNLSSDSIHEIIGAEPVLDQFQIEPASSYYGSYLEEIVTGSMATPVLGGFIFVTQSQDLGLSRRVVSHASLGQAGTTGSFQRFSSVVDTGELIYDSCLPDFSEMILVADGDKENSEYKYRGDDVVRYISDTDAFYETNNLGFESAIKQFPFEGNPKRVIQRTAALVFLGGAVGTDSLSEPNNLTGQVLNDLKNVVFKTGYSFVSKSPSLLVVNLNESFYPIGFDRSFNLSSELKSSYYVHPAEDSFVETLVDVSPGNNTLDLTPTDSAAVTHVKPTPELDVPITARELMFDYSLQFPGAIASSNVRYARATGDFNDHKMSDGVDDYSFSISIAFKLDVDPASGAQTLIERADGVASLKEYSIFVETDKKVYLRVFQSGVTTYKGVKFKTKTLSIDTWYHLVATYSGDKNGTGLSTMSLFLNGAQIDVVESSNGAYSGLPITISSNSRLQLAAGQNMGDTTPNQATEFKGNIYSTNIWRGRVLSSEEVSGLYTAEFVGVTYGITKNRASAFIKDPITPLRPGKFKYGIFNVEQSFSSVKLNPNHHGHVRDLFEQRIDTTLDKSSSPLRIKFMSGSVLVDASTTNSQNLSFFATSSIPYIDDGTFRNRSDDPDAAFTI